MTDAATPRPWRTALTDDTVIIGKDGNVATMSGDYGVDWRRMEADAALIVRALNAYDDMLAALRDAVAWCRRCDGTGRAPNEDWVSSQDETYIDCPDCRAQRAAIAKASKEGQP